ncbi:MAG: hypothetical protein K6T74_07955 [Geminicoccaceae bacterium]|nr:hypothetical protein [Geminicoccaceae bacterium]
MDDQDGRGEPGDLGRDRAEAVLFAQCPDPEREPCLAGCEVDGTSFLCFEEVRTIATLRLGRSWGMRFPQLVLVVGPDGLLRRLIRLEGAEGSVGPRLAVLDRAGGRLDLGPAEPSEAARFLAGAVELDRAACGGRLVP